MVIEAEDILKSRVFDGDEATDGAGAENDAGDKEPAEQSG